LLAFWGCTPSIVLLALSREIHLYILGVRYLRRLGVKSVGFDKQARFRGAARQVNTDNACMLPMSAPILAGNTTQHNTTQHNTTQHNNRASSPLRPCGRTLKERIASFRANRVVNRGLPWGTPPADSSGGLPQGTPPEDSPRGLPQRTPPEGPPRGPPQRTPPEDANQGTPAGDPPVGGPIGGFLFQLCIFHVF
jgi:hypothetical protein